MFSEIYNHFMRSICIDITEYTKSDGVILHLPRLSLASLFEILDEFTKLVQKESNVIELTSPLVVVGDLHGQILDLLRIFRNFPSPPNTKYLFLGDLVDRGQFSTETVILIFLAKILYPQNIFIIRGNHEFLEIFSSCGFTTELRELYGYCEELENLINKFEEAFSFIPLAAVIDQNTVCVHGGIGPQVISFDSVRHDNRPYKNFTGCPIDDILWSDPDDSVSFFASSRRGSGHKFGQDALNQFLATSKFQTLIRGHQCVNEGVKFMFDNQLATVFSASNYCGISNNQSGVLKVLENGLFESVRFDPLCKFNRASVVFDEIKSCKDESRKIDKFVIINTNMGDRNNSSNNFTFNKNNESKNQKSSISSSLSASLPTRSNAIAPPRLRNVSRNESRLPPIPNHKNRNRSTNDGSIIGSCRDQPMPRIVQKDFMPRSTNIKVSQKKRRFSSLIPANCL